MSQTDDIRALEMEIYKLGQKLHQLRKEAPPEVIPNYPLQTLEGTSCWSSTIWGRSGVSAWRPTAAPS